MSLLLLCFLLASVFSVAAAQNTITTIEVCCPTRNLTYSEQWDYFNVRPNAYMLYWLYNEETTDIRRPWFIWLQGGPGGSSAGYGNFEELGPLDVNLKPRKTTWLSRGDLLFVDSPVGAGFSYVTNDSAYTTDVDQTVSDLTDLTAHFLSKYGRYKERPCYIVGESYGGKVTAVFARRLHQAIKAGNISMNLRGAGLCSSWVSPIHYVDAWPEFLYYFSRLSTGELTKANAKTQECNDFVQNGHWSNATKCWMQAEYLLDELSGGTSWYNILKQMGQDSWSRYKDKPGKSMLFQVHPPYDLDSLMNGPVREKLGIVPANFTFGEQGDHVFGLHESDFMKPVIDSVDYLLNNTNITVFIFNGQLDLICNIAGMEQWVNKLSWPGMKYFQTSKRQAVMDKFEKKDLVAFMKKYKNLYLFWMLNAGHMVPADAPTATLTMLDMMTAA